MHAFVFVLFFCRFALSAYNLLFCTISHKNRHFTPIQEIAAILKNGYIHSSPAFLFTENSLFDIIVLYFF